MLKINLDFLQCFCDVSVSLVYILTIVLQVLDVLVEKIQNSESDDIAVLLLGYEEEMLKMLRNQNPGVDNTYITKILELHKIPKLLRRLIKCTKSKWWNERNFKIYIVAGLRRRFPIEQAFHFEDYNEIELLKIFQQKCKQQNIRLASFQVKNQLND